MTATALAEKITASDPVRRWRLEELVRAGYSPTDALVLSGRREVDLHLATSLLRDGCPVATALKILIWNVVGADLFPVNSRYVVLALNGAVDFDARYSIGREDVDEALVRALTPTAGYG